MNVIVKMKNTDNDEPKIVKAELTLTIGNKDDISLTTIKRMLHEYSSELFPTDRKIRINDVRLPTNIRDEYKTLGFYISEDTIFTHEDKKWELVIKV